MAGNYPRGIYKQRGVFYLDFTYEGRRYRRSLRTKNLAVARKLAHKERDRIMLVHAGLASPETTIDEILERFLEYAEPRRAESTMGIYRRSYDHWLDLYAGRQAKKLGPAEVDDWATRRMQEGGVAPGTLRIEYSALRTAFNWAVERDFLHRHKLPSPKKILPQPVDREIVYLEPEEIEALLEACDAPIKGGQGATRPRPTPLAEMAATALFAGLRLSEFLYLDRADLDFARRELKVRAKPDEGFVPKAKRERTIPIFRPLLQWLRPHVEAENIGEGPLFRTSNGTRYGKYNAGRELRSAAERADLDHKIGAGRGSWNVLRHTFACHLVREGMTIFKVSKLLGHASVETTEQYYATLVPNQLHEEGDEAFWAFADDPAPDGPEDDPKIIQFPGNYDRTRDREFGR